METTREQFIERASKYLEERGRALSNIYNERLSSILMDFKYEVNGGMFDYDIEDITPDAWRWDTYTNVTWYCEKIHKTIVIAEVEYNYIFDEVWEIYDLFMEWNKMIKELEDEMNSVYVLVEHPQGTDDDTPWISVYRKLEDAKKRLEELYEQDKESFDTEEWKDEESYCLSRDGCREQISVYITKQKAF